MANETFPLGRDAKCYYNTAGKLVGDSGVETAQAWLDDAATVVASHIRNISLNTSNNYADTSTRSSTAGGFQSQTPVTKNAEITIDTIWNLNDTFLTGMMTAWSSDSRIGLAVLNRDKSSLSAGDILNGLVGNFFVGMTKDEAVDDVQRGNFTVTHSDSGVWYNITAP